MTTNKERADVLARALRAGLAGNRKVVEDSCTDDIRVWAPALTAGSLTELLALLERRDPAFADIELDVTPLDVGGDFACVEWTVRMTHNAPLVLGGGNTIDATGERVTLHGATIAEFEGDRICALRQYWDEFAVLEQLGVLTAEDV
jgi:hypothetical protein